MKHFFKKIKKKSRDIEFVNIIFTSRMLRVLFSIVCGGIAGCAPSIQAICYPQSTPYGGGTGTASNPYRICSATHLQNINQNLSANFLMTQSLDLTNSNFSPIGSYNNNLPFTGTFDGGGNSLLNWTYNNILFTDAVGLFSSTTGIVKNLNLVNFQITTGNTRTGILAGFMSGVFTNCSVSGTVTGVGIVGGIAGSADLVSGQTISYCSSFANVIGSGTYIGGLVGIGGNLTVNHSFSSGNVTCNATNDCGGLIGEIFLTSTISNSYYSGAVKLNSAGGYVGGMVGVVYGTTLNIWNSYSVGAVQGYSGSYAGGAVGRVYFTGTSILNLANIYVAGPISGLSTNGALLGLNQNIATSTNSYWDSQATNQSSTADSGSTIELTAAMQTQSTYTGWDFVNIWNPPVSGQSYPTLR